MPKLSLEEEGDENAHIQNKKGTIMGNVHGDASF